MLESIDISFRRLKGNVRSTEGAKEEKWILLVRTDEVNGLVPDGKGQVLFFPDDLLCCPSDVINFFCFLVFCLESYYFFFFECPVICYEFNLSDWPNFHEFINAECE